MYFSLFEVLVLVGVIQGFVLSIWIWLGKRSDSKRLLAWMLTIFNLLCIKILVLVSGLWEISFIRYIPLAVDLAIQPLVYLYICSLAQRGFVIKKTYLLHFIPFALSLAYSLFVYISVLPVQVLTLKDAIAHQLRFNEVKEIEDYLSIFSSFVYWFAGLRKVLQYRNWLFNNISDTDYPTYTWLRNIAILLGILILGLSIDIALDYLGGFGQRHFFHWRIFFIYLAILIYYLGFRGFLLPDKEGPAPTTIAEPANPTAGTMIRAEEQERTDVKNAILKALEVDKLYRHPDLSLQVLAKHIGKSATLVSSVINKEMQESFRGLVNACRVEEMKERLQNPDSRYLSILGLAYECGFNSEASFYRIFKASTSLSPKEYLTRSKKDSQNLL